MFEVGFVGSIPNVLRRGGIFYFRRAVPVDLRHRLRKCELTRSLATAEHKLAKLRSRKLYIISERVFDVVRAEPMLKDTQLAEIVQDFYETVISEENKFRLKGGAISEEQRQGRIEYPSGLSSKAVNVGGSSAALLGPVMPKHAKTIKVVAKNKPLIVTSMFMKTLKSIVT